MQKSLCPNSLLHSSSFQRTDDHLPLSLETLPREHRESDPQDRAVEEHEHSTIGSIRVLDLHLLTHPLHTVQIVDLLWTTPSTFANEATGL